ncbi:hypothetical protein [Trichoplusia ni ascovirus 2c]|uniref:hypothetical protein n=1 Tax=Trichoplusia ni ascovirus 2c TaxID=328615 RepID=UPI0000E4420E|nr:hypothetical protein TNAV2c_gp054 [Trichoplusia ni ascovirus 2c]ABF70571.1 hypothetical protein [Trichoplusia ni ascovirus 2c]AUS94158.1 hypothetical protein [Trichoplusia ni ascovirus 6b]
MSNEKVSNNISENVTSVSINDDFNITKSRVISDNNLKFKTLYHNDSGSDEIPSSKTVNNLYNLRLKSLGPLTDEAIIAQALESPGVLSIGRFIEKTSYPISRFQYNMALSNRRSPEDVRISDPKVIGIKNVSKLKATLKRYKQKIIVSGDEFIIPRPLALQIFYNTSEGYNFNDDVINLFELYCKYIKLYHGNTLRSDRNDYEI